MTVRVWETTSPLTLVMYISSLALTSPNFPLDSHHNLTVSLRCYASPHGAAEHADATNPSFGP